MIDLMIVAGYFAVMLTVGWRARKGSPDSYWVAERRYGTVLLSASLVATIFGASSTVGIIGLGYSRGLTGAWWAMIGGVALVPFAFFLASRVRKLEVYTLPDILRGAYGDRVAIPGAVVIAVAWCGVVAAQIVAGALILEGVFTVPFQAAVAMVSVVFVLYTFWGGQLSVVRTDAWQLVLFVTGIVLTLGLVVGANAAIGPLDEGIPFGFLDFPVSESFGWYELLVFYPLIVGLPYLVGPDIYSRALCAKHGRIAKNAALLAAFVVIPLSLLLALLGVMIHAYFPDIAAESALPVAVGALAPAGIKGLIVAGVLGAIMSSADTTLISASTIVSLNVVSPLKALSRDQELRVTRGVLVIVGVVAWAIAAFQQGIISSLLLAYTVFVGGVALPTLATFWRERLGVTTTGAFWSVLVGGLFAILGGLAGGELFRALVGGIGDTVLGFILGWEYPAILPLVLSAAVLFGISRLGRGQQD